MIIKVKDWNFEEVTERKPKTTFYTDLGIAEVFGEEAVIDTANRVFEEWHENAEYFSEFVIALNWKIWEHYKTNEKLARVYDKLWHKYDDWCKNNYKGKDFETYFDITD